MPQKWGDGTSKLPKRLINTYRLFFEETGWFEVGLYPTFDDDEADFQVLLILMVGRSHIMLNEDEAANFFMHLRKMKKFANEGGSEEYFEDVKADFFGSFWMEKLRRGNYIIYFTDEEGDFQNAGPIHERDLRKILRNEQKLNEFILMLKMQKKDLIRELETLARECNGEPERVHQLHSGAPVVQFEMSTNHFEFFEDFMKSL